MNAPPMHDAEPLDWPGGEVEKAAWYAGYAARVVAEKRSRRHISWIEVLREWFGAERYARDYEFLDANYRKEAEAVARYAESTHRAREPAA